MSKNPGEAMDFLNYVAETSKAWDEPNPREVERMRPTTSSKGGMYSLTEDMEMRAKISTLSRRLEEREINMRCKQWLRRLCFPTSFASFVSLPSTKESIVQLFLQ